MNFRKVLTAIFALVLAVTPLSPALAASTMWTSPDRTISLTVPDGWTEVSLNALNAGTLTSAEAGVSISDKMTFATFVPQELLDKDKVTGDTVLLVMEIPFPLPMMQKLWAEGLRQENVDEEIAAMQQKSGSKGEVSDISIDRTRDLVSFTTKTKNDKGASITLVSAMSFRDSGIFMLTLSTLSREAKKYRPAFDAAYQSLAFHKIAPFEDVPLAHPNAEAVSFLKLQGVISGYDSTHFGPDMPLRRGELLKLAIEGAHINPDSNDSNPYKDVSDTHTLLPYILYGYHADIAKGYPDSTFHPDQPTSYAEAVKMFMNTFHIETDTTSCVAKPVQNAATERFETADGRAWYRSKTDASAQPWIELDVGGTETVFTFAEDHRDNAYIYLVDPDRGNYQVRIPLHGGWLEHKLEGSTEWPDWSHLYAVCIPANSRLSSFGLEAGSDLNNYMYTAQDMGLLPTSYDNNGNVVSVDASKPITRAQAAEILYRIMQTDQVMLTQLFGGLTDLLGSTMPATQ